MGKHNNFMPSKDTVYVRKDTRYGAVTRTSAWNNCVQLALTKDEWRAIRSKRVKLPKSWKHWCQVCDLKITDGKHHSGFYLKGLGYHWRVSNRNMFQRGDDYDKFDKWALCNIDELPTPKTLDEFKETICKLVFLAIQS